MMSDVSLQPTSDSLFNNCIKLSCFGNMKGEEWGAFHLMDIFHLVDIFQQHQKIA